MKVTLKLNSKGYQNAVRKYLGTMGKRRFQAARALFFELIRLVIDKTPVEFGQARGGWGAGADAMGMSEAEVLAGAPKADASKYAEGRAVSELKEEKSGTVLTMRLMNGVLHAEFLEEGTSKQAPYGMVAISQREIQKRLGGGELPAVVLAGYMQGWKELGLPVGTEFRAGMLRSAGVHNA